MCMSNITMRFNMKMITVGTIDYTISSKGLLMEGYGTASISYTHKDAKRHAQWLRDMAEEVGLESVTTDNEEDRTHFLDRADKYTARANVFEGYARYGRLPSLGAGL